MPASDRLPAIAALIDARPAAVAEPVDDDAVHAASRGNLGKTILRFNNMVLPKFSDCGARAVPGRVLHAARLPRAPSRTRPVAA